MALIVETGAGGSDSESYISVADADAYVTKHGDSVNSVTWATKTTAQKEQALRTSTQYLDARYALTVLGTRANQLQALLFPRIGVVDRDGFYLSSTTIPVKWKDAQVEAGLRSLTESLYEDLDEPGTIASESVTVGPISAATAYVGGKQQVKQYRLIDALVAPLVASGAMVYRG